MDFAHKLQERTGKGHVSYSAIKYAADGSKQQDMKLFELYMTGELYKKSPALQFGSLYDCMLLEPETLKSRFVCVNDDEILEKLSGQYKSPKSSSAYKSWMKTQEEELGNKGVSLVSMDDWSLATDMVGRLKGSQVVDKDTGELVPVSHYLTGETQHEINAWIEDVPVRGFLDVLSRDNNFITDSKSTRSIHGFRYDVNSFCYDIQAFIYSEVMGVDTFYWVVQEKKSPYLCGVYKASPRTLDQGKRKFWSAIGNIRTWLDSSQDTETFALSGEI